MDSRTHCVYLQRLKPGPRKVGLFLLKGEAQTDACGLMDAMFS